MIKEYAEFVGHEVTEAENGMEAVSICKEHDFDIIVMDVMIPKMDGFSACKEIRKVKKTPVLMPWHAAKNTINFSDLKSEWMIM